MFAIVAILIFCIFIFILYLREYSTPNSRGYYLGGYSEKYPRGKPIIGKPYYTEEDVKKWNEYYSKEKKHKHKKHKHKK